METNRYQMFAMKTRNTELTYDEQLLNGALGLCGEAGEVADILKKSFFQGHKLSKEKIINELGDVLWYVALICHVLDIEMDTVACANINKLRERFPDGFSSERSINRVEEDN